MILYEDDCARFTCLDTAVSLDCNWLDAWSFNEGKDHRTQLSKKKKEITEHYYRMDNQLFLAHARANCREGLWLKFRLWNFCIPLVAWCEKGVWSIIYCRQSSKSHYFQKVIIDMITGVLFSKRVIDAIMGFVLGSEGECVSHKNSLPNTCTDFFLLRSNENFIMT